MGIIQPETSMHDLLNRYPELAEPLLTHRMACVGCLLARFHTIEEACAIYHLDMKALLTELERCAGQPPSPSPGTA